MGFGGIGLGSCRRGEGGEAVDPDQWFDSGVFDGGGAVAPVELLLHGGNQEFA